MVSNSWWTLSLCRQETSMSVVFSTSHTASKLQNNQMIIIILGYFYSSYLSESTITGIFLEHLPFRKYKYWDISTAPTFQKVQILGHFCSSYPSESTNTGTFLGLLPFRKYTYPDISGAPTLQNVQILGHFWISYPSESTNTGTFLELLPLRKYKVLHNQQHDTKPEDEACSTPHTPTHPTTLAHIPM